MDSEALRFQKSVFGEDLGKDDLSDNSHNGVCSKCGSCCSDIIPLSAQEIDTLRHFVQKNNYKPNTRIKAPMTATYDMTCPFLNENNRCDVYGIRPKMCRLYKCWQQADENFSKLSKSERDGFLSMLSSDVAPRSIRKEVFNQEVPF